MHCVQCGTTTNLNLHHKEYRCDGGKDEAANLQVLCRDCHVKHHSTQGDFARWGYVGGKKTASNKWRKTYRNLRQFQGMDGALRFAVYAQQYEMQAFYEMLRSGYY